MFNLGYFCIHKIDLLGTQLTLTTIYFVLCGETLLFRKQTQLLLMTERQHDSLQKSPLIASIQKRDIPVDFGTLYK